MSAIYTYDGSLEGFLTVVFEIYDKKEPPQTIVPDGAVQTGLFIPVINIITEPEKASRVEKGIEKHIGTEGFYRVMEAFCCGFEPDTKDMKIYRFLRLLFERGAAAEQMHNLPQTADFNDLVHKTGHEIGKQQGFLRFRELSNGILYAKYAPDNDITHFLTPYFAQRNNLNSFVIYDESRGICGLYNGTQWLVTTGFTGLETVFSEEERVFNELWQQYYDTVTIASRKNNRLRAQFMPRRYWKYLVEFVKD